MFTGYTTQIWTQPSKITNSWNSGTRISTFSPTSKFEPRFYLKSLTLPSHNWNSISTLGQHLIFDDTIDRVVHMWNSYLHETITSSCSILCRGENICAYVNEWNRKTFQKLHIRLPSRVLCSTWNALLLMDGS